MSKTKVVVATVIATVLVAGVGAALMRLGVEPTRSAYAVTHAAAPLTPSTRTGGRGGGPSGGPWPGNDYPANLQNAPQDSIVDPFGEDNRECVSYVAETLSISFGYQLPFYGGNAVDWLSKATGVGVPSGTTPTLYSVAYSAAHDHVALVVAITGSGSGQLVTIEQYNQFYNGTYSWDVEPASDFDHYIYFLPQSRPGAQAPATTSPPVTSATPLSVAAGGSGGLGTSSSSALQDSTGTTALQGGSSSDLQGAPTSIQGSSAGLQGAGGAGGGSAESAPTTSNSPVTSPPTTETPTTATPVTSPPTTATPVTSPPTTATPAAVGFTIEDDVYGGTWARTDPNDGTWYPHSQTPPNGAYWYRNGLGVAVSCAEPAASYGVVINGQNSTWNWWAHVTDGKWVPTVVFSTVWSDGDPSGVPLC